MAFPRRLLNPDEEVVLDLRPHWWFMAKVSALLAGAFILFVVLWTTFDQAILTLLGLVLVLVAAGAFGARYLKWTSTMFVLTTDRLVYREGVVAKRGVEIPLQRVNNVNFSQTIFERLLGTGDLLIESAGQDGQSRFKDIRHPELVANEIHAQAEANEHRTFERSYGRIVAAGQPAEPSIPDQIARLHDLMTRGAISPSEFEAKKAELLRRL